MKRWLYFVFLPPAAMFVVLLSVWHFYIGYFEVPAYILPSPLKVVDAFKDDPRTLLRCTWVTAKAALLGFALASIIGVFAAVVFSLSKWVQRAVYPYTVFLQTVPIVVIAPQLIVWFGYGIKPIVASAFIVSIFPVIANTLTGLLSIDPALRDMFRLYRAGWFATLFKLNLPSALPHIFTGLRIAAGLAVIGTIVGEFLASFVTGDDYGLGILVTVAIKEGNPGKVFAAVLMASVLGLAMFAMINLLSWLTLRNWHSSAQGE
jgi:NitT/TauT family transport system permease protein